MYHITVLICIFPMTNIKVKHFFVYLMAIGISFSMKSLFKYFAHRKGYLFTLLMVSFAK